MDTMSKEKAVEKIFGVESNRAGKELFVKMLIILVDSTIALEHKSFVTRMDEALESLPYFGCLTPRMGEPGSPAFLIEKALDDNIKIIKEYNIKNITWEELKKEYLTLTASWYQKENKKVDR